MGNLNIDDQEMTREQVYKDLSTQVNTHECICESLRLVYDLVHELDPGPLRSKLTERLIDAFIMGKKMQARLIHYRQVYPDDPGSMGHHLRAMPGAEDRLRMRQERCQ